MNTKIQTKWFCFEFQSECNDMINHIVSSIYEENPTAYFYEHTKEYIEFLKTLKEFLKTKISTPHHAILTFQNKKEEKIIDCIIHKINKDGLEITSQKQRIGSECIKLGHFERTILFLDKDYFLKRVEIKFGSYPNISPYDDGGW